MTEDEYPASSAVQQPYEHPLVADLFQIAQAVTALHAPTPMPADIGQAISELGEKDSIKVMAALDSVISLLESGVSILQAAKSNAEYRRLGIDSAIDALGEHEE